MILQSRIIVVFIILLIFVSGTFDFPLNKSLHEISFTNIYFTKTNLRCTYIRITPIPIQK